MVPHAIELNEQPEMSDVGSSMAAHAQPVRQKLNDTLAVQIRRAHRQFAHRILSSNVTIERAAAGFKRSKSSMVLS